MADTVLGGVIEFFVRLGIYDVILPFLLVFTLMYAILERSKILGTEKWGDETITRKNLNAMVAFSTAFIVIASSRVVEFIFAISAKVVVVLTLLVFFMLMLSTVSEEGEAKLDGYWKPLFAVICFIAIAFIFLDTIELQEGVTVFDGILGFIVSAWTSAAAASVIFMLILIGLIYLITRGD